MIKREASTGSKWWWYKVGEISLSLAMRSKSLIFGFEKLSV
jgi:hypothetical protein